MGYDHPAGGTSITTVYKYGRTTLKEDIGQRQEGQNYYAVEEVWQILYSMVRGLEYLESNQIGYGVLHPRHVFIDEGVKLMDPSAIAEDPLSVTSGRLYSPEIVKGYEEIDILRSDVFVLGLCLI